MTDPSSSETDQDSGSIDSDSVQVAVRVRPRLPHEDAVGCVEIYQGRAIQIGGSAGPTFTFNHVLDQSTTQVQVFDRVVEPLVAKCLQGYNATILAYGQTGSGKTHTIVGSYSTEQQPESSQDEEGIIPRALEALFAGLEQQRANTEYEVRLQCLELYGEELRDLLSPSSSKREKLTIRDVGLDEPEVVGATSHQVETPQEAMLCLTRGMLRRVTGSTAMNATSSRSHAILSVLLEQTTTTNEITSDDETPIVVKRSKFNFVDLAGSERQKRTQAVGQRFKEGVDINKGLLVLGNVISSLESNKFVPYRDSKLTRLLKGSLGGNHKTLMIACVSPSCDNLEESLNCLRYANRAKNIQNHAVVNVDATTRLIQQLQAQLATLAQDVLNAGTPTRFSRHDLEAFSQQLTQPTTANNNNKNNTTTTPAATNINPLTNNPLTASPSGKSREQELQHELDRTRQALHATREEVAWTEGQLQKANAERRLYRQSIFCSPSPKKDTLTSSLLEVPPSLSAETQYYTPKMGSPRSSNNNLLLYMQSDEDEEQEALQHKYLHDDDYDETDGGSQHSEEPQGDEESEEEDEESPRRQQLVETHLVELSQNIMAKEDLIQQLQLSEEKYETMRAFYEEKLQKMELQLTDRQVEREQLVEELKRLEDSNSCTKDLQARLVAKDQQIAVMRKKQRELRDLTTVSARNQSEISRLHQEVVAMKSRKVALQRQVGEERKLHASQVKQLRKEALQKERQVQKLKKESDRKAREAERARKLAKTRLEQVDQMKAKYKDKEKELRMLSIKRGVMHKAGLDSVILGRRNSANSTKSVVVDGLRTFFDQKITEVGRKENMAEKLAEEWEEHFELVLKRDELLKDGLQDEAAKEALDVQISFKEDRIRRLAQRVDKHSRPPLGTGTPPDTDSFFFDEQFKTICNGLSPAMALKTAVRVLFGMAVRERRRVASLAKTASTLDEKVQTTSKEVDARDLAFQSYMEEQRQELAYLAQNQQQRILSLMAMIQEDKNETTLGDTTNVEQQSIGEGSRAQVQPKMLVLANERIVALELQLRELQAAKEHREMQHQLERQAHASLVEKTSDIQELEYELSELRSVLRQIREMVSRSKTETPREEVLEVLTNALHPAKGGLPSRTRRRKSRTGSTKSVENLVTPRVKKHVEIMHTSDSEDGEAVPQWAEEIISDLAWIAQGKVPPSLCDSIVDDKVFDKSKVFDRLISDSNKPSGDDTQAKMSAEDAMLNSLLSYEDDASHDHERGSVFDRLSNPENFTGVQKQKTAGRGSLRHRSKSAGATTGHEKEHRLDTAGMRRHHLSEGAFLEAGGAAADAEVEKKSVFERLNNPENFTGVQKQRNSVKGEGKEFHPPQVEDEAGRNSVFERLNNPENFTGVQKQRTSQKYEEKEQHVVPLEDDFGKNSVFERLNNPENFTGVAAKVHRSHRSKVSGEIDQESSDSAVMGNLSESPGQRMKINTYESPGQRKKIVHYPGSPERRSKSSTGLHTSSDTLSNDLNSSSEQLSVFERLMSPSNYTGTQKEKFMQHLEKTSSHERQDEASKKGRDGADDGEADEMLDMLLGEDDSRDDNDDQESPEPLKEVCSPKMERTKRMDVFQRLQTTPTQSYVVKLGPNSEDSLERTEFANELRSPSSGDRQTVSLKPPPFSNADRDNHGPDVFERLQKTTTEAYAKKKNNLHTESSDHNSIDTAPLHSVDGPSPPSLSSPNAARSLTHHVGSVDEYTQQDVFERLQNTTTHAYAVKQSSSGRGSRD